MNNQYQLKKSSQDDDLTRHLYESAILRLRAKKRREQRISNLMSIVDAPLQAILRYKMLRRLLTRFTHDCL